MLVSSNAACTYPDSFSGCCYGSKLGRIICSLLQAGDAMADCVQTGVLCQASVLPHSWNAPLHGLGGPQPAVDPGIRHVNGAHMVAALVPMRAAQADINGFVMLAHAMHHMDKIAPAKKTMPKVSAYTPELRPVPQVVQL